VEVYWLKIGVLIENEEQLFNLIAAQMSKSRSHAAPPLQGI